MYFGMEKSLEEYNYFFSFSSINKKNIIHDINVKKYSTDYFLQHNQDFYKEIMHFCASNNHFLQNMCIN